jgi:hypothetical protein
MLMGFLAITRWALCAGLLAPGQSIERPACRLEPVLGSIGEEDCSI